MEHLKLLRCLGRTVLTYGTIIALVIIAVVSMVAKNFDRVLFFSESFIVSYCCTGIIAGLFMFIEKLKLRYRTTLLLYIPATIVGMVGGSFLLLFQLLLFLLARRVQVVEEDHKTRDNQAEKYVP